MSDISFAEETHMDISSGKGLEYRQLLLWQWNRILIIGSTKLNMDSEPENQRIAITDAYSEAVKDLESSIPKEYLDGEYKKDLKEELARYHISQEKLDENDIKIIDLKKDHARKRFNLAINLLGRRNLLIELSGKGGYIEV